MPAILDLYEIPYTFADPLVMSVCLHKQQTKTLVSAAGVPTPKSVLFIDWTDLESLALAFPVFAKPLAQGTSKGVTPDSQVDSSDDCASVCDRLLQTVSRASTGRRVFAGPRVHGRHPGNRSSQARVLGNARDRHAAWCRQRRLFLSQQGRMRIAGRVPFGSRESDPASRRSRIAWRCWHGEPWKLAMPVASIFGVMLPVGRNSSKPTHWPDCTERIPICRCWRRRWASRTRISDRRNRAIGLCPRALSRGKSCDVSGCVGPTCLKLQSLRNDVATRSIRSDLDVLTQCREIRDSLERLDTRSRRCVLARPGCGRAEASVHASGRRVQLGRVAGGTDRLMAAATVVAGCDATPYTGAGDPAILLSGDKVQAKFAMSAAASRRQPGLIARTGNRGSDATSARVDLCPQSQSSSKRITSTLRSRWKMTQWWRGEHANQLHERLSDRLAATGHVHLAEAVHCRTRVQFVAAGEGRATASVRAAEIDFRGLPPHLPQIVGAAPSGRGLGRVSANAATL